MGLEHNIIYRSKEGLLNDEWKLVKYNPLSINNIDVSDEDHLEIHDDILRWFNDYFCWIEMYNPSKNEQVNGFCYWGITIIKNESMMDLKQLIISLINIFENSPAEITLTGLYNINDKNYNVIKISKNKLLAMLNKFKLLTEKAIKNEGYILHCGI